MSWVALGEYFVFSTSNVYINNLPTAFTEAHLYQLRAAFGTILNLCIMLRETGTCYGFVLSVARPQSSVHLTSFETIEVTESCIMWLRQFLDLHPSFARVCAISRHGPLSFSTYVCQTPLKTVAHKLLDHQQPANLRSIAFPEDTSGSPIRFTRVHTEDDLTDPIRVIRVIARVR